MTSEFDGRPEPPPHDGEPVAIVHEPKKTNGHDHESDFGPGLKIGSLRILSDYDATEAKEREYLLKGLLSPGEMSTVFGLPGCGKTFFVIYVARAIARGEGVFGRKVHGTRVLYAALEGATGFNNRLKAEIDRFGHCEDFYYVAQGINLYDSATDRKDLIEAILATKAGLVIIDTLARALAGGSENAPEDMGAFIKNCDAIRSQTGAHVLVVHHSGKDRDRGMRGHSALLGAADVVIEVVKNENMPHAATVTKAKDDADNVLMQFELSVKELGVDQDGDKITTCLVRELDDDQKPQRSKKDMLNKDDIEWLRNIQELFNSGENISDIQLDGEKNVTYRCVTRDRIRQWCLKRGLSDVTGTVTADRAMTAAERQVLSRRLGSLRQKGKIRIDGDWVALIS